MVFLGAIQESSGYPGKRSRRSINFCAQGALVVRHAQTAQPVLMQPFPHGVGHQTR